MPDGRNTIAAISEDAKLKVWDIPVRLFHWCVVIAFATTIVTGYLLPVTWLQVHILTGSAIGCLILFRLVWGFTGSTYGRFANFRPNPSAAIHHLRGIFSRSESHEVGHNPLGALMVYALLAMLSAAVISGVVVLGGMFKQGPLKSFMTFADANAARELHEALAIFLLVLAGAHIAGVLFESWRTHENLARAMVTGRKRGATLPASRSYSAKPLLALAVIASSAAIIGPSTAALMRLLALGIHPVETNAAWKEECGGCHMAFPPSLLPAASWKAVMAGLADHFGEDANLEPEKAAEITTFLIGNAAETQDSLPANRLRKVDPQHPLAITATPFWKRMHRDISEPMFASKAVGSKQNCSACHADATSTAMFAPQQIHVPEEKTP